MFRPFCPSFENLEKREVFSAGPVAALQPLAFPAAGSDVPMEQVSLNILARNNHAIGSHLLAGTLGRGAVAADFHVDGQGDGSVCRVTGAANDVAFEQMGRNTGGSLAPGAGHYQILIGLLVP